MFDRFAMQGGLDLTTPYLQRVAGSLMQVLNYEPDVDGGYRKMKGFERYDGHPSPSDAFVTALNMDADMNAVALGATVTGHTSGATAVVGRVVLDEELWVDVLTGEFEDGETVSITGVADATLVSQFPETIDVTVLENPYDNIYATHPVGDVITPGLEVGDTVVGSMSTAEGVIRYVMLLPQFPVYYIEITSAITPVAGETLQKEDGVGIVVDWSVHVEKIANNPHTGAGLGLYFSEMRRSMIGEVPGSGPVRGVWDHDDYRLAFRDSEDGLSGGMFKSTSAGWQAVPLGSTMDFTDRLSTVTDLDIIPGDVVSGATSGATATVAFVGYTVSDHKAGYLSLTNIVGTFSAGEVLHSDTQSKDLATVGAVSANVLPPGGFYRFSNHNFTAKKTDYNVWGVNGVGRGFVYGTNGFSFVRTQDDALLDTPAHVTIHYDHLFYAFPGGSVQHSIVGDPLDWSGALGALEVGMGAEVMDFIVAPKALIIATSHDIQALTGSGIEDWAKNIVTDHVGVAPFTGAYQTQSMILGPAGLISIDRVDAFGDFSDAMLSDKIRSEIRRKYPQATVGYAAKTKSQYRVHFKDGVNFLFAFKYGQNGGLLGVTQFQYGDKIVRNAVNPFGRMFFSADDGFAYEADRGFSDDGAERTHFFRTSFAFQEDPDSRKRYKRITMSVQDTEFMQATVGFTFSKGKNTVPSSFLSGAVYGKGGRWDLDQWNYVFWDGADVPEIHADVEGVGTDVSIMVYISSRVIPDHVIEDMSIEYTPRRKVR